jgi:quinolinate synthase
MKKNTLEKCNSALETLQPEIKMDETIQQRAHIPIERMLALGK